MADRVRLAALACLLFAAPALGAEPPLAQLEEDVARYYSAARTALREGAECLQEDQRLWAARRDQCADARCREAAHLDRLAELHGIQPGASAVKRELPRRATLAWIVPAAADRVAAPPRAQAPPLQATGTLVDEIANGDGIVLRTADGTRYLLVMLMFLDGATAERLPLLARERGSFFTARGHRAASPQAAAFEPSRCLYLYREP